MMSASKPTPLILVVLLLYCFIPCSFCSSTDHKAAIVPCPEIEKQALLTFKRSLNDTWGALSSWNTSSGTTCCSWEGVSCSSSTGHVDGLDLSDSGLQGQINPSLLNLSRLKHLDLSINSFEETVPSFIGSLASLEYLNLSYAGVHGVVPRTIGNLSNLKSLDLGGFGDAIDSMEWLSGLSQLRQLIIFYADLSGADDWAQVISRLPSLVELRLPHCDLDYMAHVNDVNTTSLTTLDLSYNNFDSLPIPRWIFRQSNLIYLDLSYASFGGPIPIIANLTKLQYFDLSYNSLNSSIPDWLYSCKDLEFVNLAYCSLENTISDAVGNLTSLATLDLSNNVLTGKIPSGIANLCKVQRLDLSDNMFEGKIPRGIASLCKMQSLHLGGNMLEGEISDSFGNMSDCFLANIVSLDLFGNQLSGHLTHQFGEFRSLEALILSENKINGEIPANLAKSTYIKSLYLDYNMLTGNLPMSIGQLSKLEYLLVRDNKLTGNLPMSIGQLSNLTILDIENNMLEGVVTEIHFANLTKLNTFRASGNHLTLKVNPNWIPPFNLRDLRLGSWKLGASLPVIPSWLDTQKNTMEVLDLSCTGISGNIPTWFWKLMILNISHNHLYGMIPDISGLERLPRSMYLNSNQFSGKIPRVGNTLEEINLSNNSFSGGISHFICDMRNESYRLFNLHLGGNHLTGEIPDCWMKWPSLMVLNLGNNNFSGTIPNSIGFLKDMLSLNLYGNKLSGQLSVSISNCSELVKMDLSSNYLMGNIPSWIGASLPKLRFLILRSNKLSGVIPSSICNLNLVQILDISDNVISGIIPACVSNLTAMTAKRNLSKYISGDLDFSSYEFGNFLESASVATKGNRYVYGSILSLVTNIDISNNNLWGEIPEELTSLVELRSLNLAGNHLTGSIPKSIGNMTQLESLDFSRNSLLGEIPDSFKAMTSLSYLNLSYNHLTGKIPESTQLMGMNASGFIGNDLCGLPLPTNCSQGDGEHGPSQKEDNRGGVDWFYVFLSLGYAAGFSIFCTTLVLKKSWRSAYFGFMECMWDKLYVYFHIKWAKLTGHE